MKIEASRDHYLSVGTFGPPRILNWPKSPHRLGLTDQIIYNIDIVIRPAGQLELCSCNSYYQRICSVLKLLLLPLLVLNLPCKLGRSNPRYANWFFRLQLEPTGTVPSRPEAKVKLIITFRLGVINDSSLRKKAENCLSRLSNIFTLVGL